MKKFGLTIRGNSYQVKIKSIDDLKAVVEINGSSYEVILEREIQATKTPKLMRSATIATPPKSMAPATGLKKVQAPLPGLIGKINVRENDIVKVGDVLFTLEAMKMENNILAEKNGAIKSIRIKEGDTVLQGDLMMEIE
jgi:glutaconyl-CoA/methylmalonyl-CoA decarboxylase subunit gamma